MRLLSEIGEPIVDISFASAAVNAKYTPDWKEPQDLPEGE